jgi:hypothetical protein
MGVAFHGQAGRTAAAVMNFSPGGHTAAMNSRLQAGKQMTWLLFIQALAAKHKWIFSLSQEPCAFFSR